MQCYNCDSKRLKYDKKTDAYVCLDCGYIFPKQYFFISHSHLDIEKVRIIRNIIEETFFYEPILFFLKCLSEDNEILDLIRREIYERIWFVYCKSANAENSVYVQEERRYIDCLIRQGKSKRILEIELDDFEIWDEKCYDYIRNQIAFRIRKTKIFLSYSYADSALAQALYTGLQSAGYSVWHDTDLMSGGDWMHAVESQIREHSYKDGLVLALLTPDSTQRAAFMAELQYALSRGAMLLPIVINDGTLAPMDNSFLYTTNLQPYVFDTADMADSLSGLLQAIEAL